MSKELGAIYTPEGHARILTAWAIQSSTDTVLDMGIGPGVFVYQAYTRLRELGATEHHAANQIYGTEINQAVFNSFTEETIRRGLIFRNLQNINFFDGSFPALDAVIGNPPYVRRRGMEQASVDNIRAQTIKTNKSIDPARLYSLSDLYIYFLLFALPNLKLGGRVATIVADTWLNTRYGIVLREYLLKEFDIKQLISLDRSVFENADVKALLLFAVKKEKMSSNENCIRFARVRNGLPIEKLSAFITRKKAVSNKDIFVKDVNSNKLKSNMLWGAVFKTTALFDELSKKDVIKPMREIADIRIGIESLARDFFVIPAANKDRIDDQYLTPFIYSVHDFQNPIIKKNQEPIHYLFYCDLPKEKLAGSKALNHIIEGENRKTNVRGTDKIVNGYHNKDRIIKANRLYWYDLKTECDRKQNAEILLPRFIYKDYKVLWNVARYMPGGTIIQFFPKVTLFTNDIDTKVYLGILTSTFTEIALRISAQVYGGGTSNLNITAVKDVPTIDVSQLTDEQKKSLIDAYDYYLETKDKSTIDQIVYEILSLTSKQSEEMASLLIELTRISDSAKKAAHPIKKTISQKKVKK